VLDLLISKGADVDSSIEGGFTPLMWASREGHKFLVEFLISKDADVNAKTQDGETALSLAQKEGHKDIVALLKSY
jgi:ankyrin repeat protein